MGEPELVERAVRRHHLGRDPGPVLIRSRCIPTGADHAGEVLIEGDLVGLRTLAFRQAPTDVQRLGSQHQARVGREPENRRLVVPGKDTLGVGGEQPLGCEIAAVGEQPSTIAVARIRKGVGAARAPRRVYASSDSSSGSAKPEPLGDPSRAIRARHKRSRRRATRGRDRSPRALLRPRPPYARSRGGDRA